MLDVSSRKSNIDSLNILCLRSTYFGCNGMNRKKGHAVMGSPVSAVVVSLYMEYFESNAIRKTINLEEIR